MGENLILGTLHFMYHLLHFKILAWYVKKSCYEFLITKMFNPNANKKFCGFTLIISY